MNIRTRLAGLATFALVAAAPHQGFAGGAGPCEGIVIEAEAGSGQNDGWSGTAHGADVAVGGSTSWAVANCDCSSDTSCDLAGPVDAKRCLANMFTECTTNADCPSSGACVDYFGPPQPVVYFQTPLCLLTHFEGAASGSYDAATGDVSISGTLRRRMFIGDTMDRPCPRCGAPVDDPQPGEQFVCVGGARNGQPCTVEGVTPFFGGTSSDCAPSPGAVLGTGFVLRLNELASDPSARTAKLPCASFGLTGNPTVPGSNPKCTDNSAGPVCASNADCKRCTGDPTEACTSNTDCTGVGTCAEAPDQPVTCGYWCHCGFCNNDGTKPCFESSDCADGQTCQKGTGGVGASNYPQQRPNDCNQDFYICGTDAEERCDTTLDGSCTLAPYRDCETNADCEIFNAGTCTIEDRSCFEPRISRSGDSTPLGKQCAFEEKSCTTNADCAGGGDFCVADVSRADMVGVYCLSGSTSSSVNGVVGLPGPGVLSLDAFVKVCRCEGSEPACESVCGASVEECGNGEVEGDEACDGGPCCSGTCTFLASTSPCRAAAGSCDTAELCTGSAATCPADTFASTSTSCRASAGICDVAESCTGASAACPGDAFAPTATVCRAGADECDKSEQCTGTAAACPADLPQPDGSTCDDEDACTTNDQCTGGSCSGSPDPQCEGVCGDGTLDDGEACDDGNATFAAGEYCGVACVLIPCGKPTNSAGEDPLTSDALRVLRAAVGSVFCHPRVCSVDGNSSVLASDAQRILRAAVGQDVELDCPTE
jgi:hypothetical protein